MPFQDIAAETQKTLQQRPLSNRRASVRYKCGPATAGRVQLSGMEWHRAWVLDLSSTGVGLLLARSLDAGLEIAVHLKSALENATFQLSARVCHATQQPDGDWVVGCEFTTGLTADQLDAVLQ